MYVCKYDLIANTVLQYENENRTELRDRIAPNLFKTAHPS